MFREYCYRNTEKRETVKDICTPEGFRRRGALPSKATCHIPGNIKQSCGAEVVSRVKFDVTKLAFFYFDQKHFGKNVPSQGVPL